MPEPSHNRSVAEPSSRFPGWRRHLNRAKQLAEDGELHKALLSLERAAEAGADAYSCTLRMAEIYRELGALQVALECVEKAVKLRPERAQGYELLIAMTLETQKFVAAIEACQKLIKMSPRHIMAHTALATAYIQIEEFDKALRAVNVLIRFEPESADHHFKKAMICQALQNYALSAYHFCYVLHLEADGMHAAAAHEALSVLDQCQVNQIMLLANDDKVFRLKLQRDPLDAIRERGFYLSEYGLQTFLEISSQMVSNLPEPCHYRTYN